MPARVLFVDDDPRFLSGMEQRLGQRFDLHTAISGPDALRKIEGSPTFPVIVSGMRMPVMDGVQFIERARQLSPHTVFMMLTGDRDPGTVVRAVNEGKVTRFLNKPTDPGEIAEAIEQAQHQYNLGASERELLNKTFVGAMGVFSDVMETLRPELRGRAAATEQFVEGLRERVGAPSRWEFKIASKLFLMGQAFYPEPLNAEPTSEVALRRLVKRCEVSARMVGRIPRMELVSQIIRSTPAADGDLFAIEPRGEGDVVRLGATLLRIANLVEAMSHLGIDEGDAIKQVQACLPKAYPPLIDAARAIYPVEVDAEGELVEVEDLRIGMVLHDNLVRPDGATLLRAGRRLSQTHIDKLLTEKQLLCDFPPVVVTKSSFRAAYPDTVPA